MIHSDEMFDDSSQKKRHNVESISSSSVFDKLTDELLIKTLIRLPQKPANICKCISVYFRSLISTSYFVRRYLNHHKINDSFALYYHLVPRVLYYRSKTLDPKNPTCIAFGSPIFESPGFSLSFLPEPETIQYLASNNGLVLCSFPRRHRRVAYFVCNPLTKQWIALPPTPTAIEHPYIGFICLNPQYLSNDDHEQGRASSFKVVRIRTDDKKVVSDSLRLEIFCSESGRWSKDYHIPSVTSYKLFFRHNEGCPSAVVCGGLLHWGDLSTRDIITYDPCNGKIGTIKFPPGITITTYSFKSCLGESDGRLRYGTFMDSKTYRVWELKDRSNGGEWFLLHTVHFNEMESTVRNSNDAIGFPPPHPLNQDIVFFWCHVSHRILEYNMRTKLLKLPCFPQDTRNISPRKPIFFPFVLPCWPTTIPFIRQHGES